MKTGSVNYSSFCEITVQMKSFVVPAEEGYIFL